MSLILNKAGSLYAEKGKTRVKGQSKLFCLMQNMEKLENYRELAASGVETSNGIPDNLFTKTKQTNA